MQMHNVFKKILKLMPVHRREQIPRLGRYLLYYLRHATPKRLLNLIKTEYKLFTGNTDLKNTYPYFFIIEISDTCNLRCPVCQMGKGKCIQRKNLMSLSNYIKLIEPIKDYVFQVSLYNWGEPFLNKDIYGIIGHNTSQNIGTVVSSNLNVAIEPERLIRSGLEHLIISADGITQAVYERYRRGGRIEVVLDNLKRIVDVRRRLNSKIPYIEWQSLVSRWNEPHLEEIKERALALGVDEVRFCNMNFYSEGNSHAAEREWLPKNPLYRDFGARSYKGAPMRIPCFWLWRQAIINTDGGMAPCCLFDVPDWGNLFDTPFPEVWNNKRFTEARSRYRKNAQTQGPKLICDDCTYPFIYNEKKAL